jgi:eukaryotic-like serine/threonine-protein kinase
MTEPNRQLGRYELLQKIAMGGMGEIYLAKSHGAAGFEKSCIIKTILPHLAGEEEFVSKFLDEASIVVQLMHGNIVQVFDMGEEDGEYYIAMEYIPGRDLREVLKRLSKVKDRVPVDIALYVVGEVCKGLDYAHRKAMPDGATLNIVHRDVSPSNILLSDEGGVKIIDFGIARATDRLSKTVSGRIQGKVYYMSPEQAQGKDVDNRSDIFSLGVVLYELLTGVRPFEAKTDLASLDLVRQCNYESPSTLNPHVSDDVDAIIAKALTRHAEDRFESTDQMQVEILQHLYTSGRPPTSRDLAQWLKEVFPDGFERDDLRISRRVDGISPAKRMSLEEAMNVELDRLADGETAVDPLDTTHIGSVSVSGEVAGSARRTPTPSVLPIAEIRTTSSERSVLKSGFVVVLATCAAVAALFGLQFYFIGGSSDGDIALREGLVRIESEPSGASLRVDGALIVDAKTPYELKIDAGRHLVSVGLDGYQPEVLQLSVAPGTREEVVAKLKPSRRGDAPRTISLRAQPDKASIEVNGKILGSSPQVVVIRPGDILNIGVSHPGCDRMQYTVSYTFAEDVVEVPALRCNDNKAVGAERSTKAGLRKSTQGSPSVKRAMIRSDPSGALIKVDGSNVGVSPVTAKWRTGTTVVIEASLDGYLPLKVTRKVDAIRDTLNLELEKREMGCLNVRLMDPAIGEIAIDGKWLGPPRSRLERHPLSVGLHTVRIRNRAADKNDEFRVLIKPGKTCHHLVAWDEG